MERLQQTPKVIWFTGLSGSGKTTLATAVEYELYNRNYKTFLLDGDNIRNGINSDLGFTEENRKENIRRTSEITKLFLDSGLIILAAFISPFKEDREKIQKLVGPENYLEIHVDCPLEICELRDVKGLYKKARNGTIPNFTGIDSPYEKPENPFIRISTDIYSVKESVDLLIDRIQAKIEYPN